MSNMGPVEAIDISRIESEKSALFNLSFNMFDVLEKLEKKLSPILSPSIATPKEKDFPKEPSRAVRSQFCEQLSNIKESLQRSIDKIVEIDNRVEL